MSDRKLRAGTRKDYNKMENGVNGATEKNNGEDEYACVAQNQNKQQHQHGGDDGDRSGDKDSSGEGSEVDLDAEYECESEFESEEDDEELLEAERKLELMKKQQKSC